MQSNTMSEMTTLAFTLAASKKIEGKLDKKFDSLKEQLNRIPFSSFFNSSLPKTVLITGT